MQSTATTVHDFADLLRRARSGEMVAWGQLLERYRNYLNLAAQVQIGKLLQSKFDPADIVQECFLTAHRRIDQFRGTTEGELVAWLRQILATTAANMIRYYCGVEGRDVRKERAILDALEQSSRAWAIAAPVAPQSSPSRQAAKREEAVLLADALYQLPPDYRQVIVLRQLQGLSFADTARQMNRSVDSVEKLWVRALGQLRKRLGALA